ncbi:MAG: AI-2E family transporter [Lewinellaceae bacterium]|nr:AI-2E family transporter [Lewinellaceae bacterium]
MVYIFMFLYYRSHFKKFILKLVPATEKAETTRIITEASLVGQKYVSGMGLMIVMLWVLYSIGFSIVGVENAVFFAVLCGILEIVPYVGNLTGTVITLLMVVAQGGGSSIILGVLITYGLVQFFQNNVLTPLIVGSEVNINPLFTIMALLAGELVWSIPGMIMGIPLLGMLKIICDHVEPLKPYGFLLGSPGPKTAKTGMLEKVKGWFK